MARRCIYNKLKILHNNHWAKENFCQRITTRCWKLLLLNYDDTVVFEGRIRQLVAKRLGCGVVEISKKTEEKENGS